jgi:hypothetical protein
MSVEGPLQRKSISPACRLLGFELHFAPLMRELAEPIFNDLEGTNPICENTA